MDQVSRALALDAENKAARDTLALLYYERFIEAERRGNREDAAWLLRMVERYDTGSLRAALRENGSFVVTSEPHGARVTLRRLVERDRRLTGELAAELGRTPLTHDAVASGVYEVVVSHAGYEPALVPIRMRRGERCSIHVAMIQAGMVPPGFVRITGGPFLAGADLQQAHVEDFAIMLEPVRLWEYARFLDDIAQREPDAASGHIPWVEMHGALLRPGPDGRHVWSEASPLSQNPLSPDADLPVVGIGRSSAVAYAAWLSQQAGRVHRLPTELEWEKAARGTDGRSYPWGDRFDATFCSMIESTESAATLRPIGEFPDDVSPYGVRDMAGGVREWCIDDVDAGRTQAVCRGGAWYLRGRECTVTSRWLVEAETRNPGIGFRLCVDLV
jgi:serine/threonine-protein kinase